MRVTVSASGCRLRMLRGALVREGKGSSGAAALSLCFLVLGPSSGRAQSPPPSAPPPSPPAPLPGFGCRPARLQRSCALPALVRPQQPRREGTDMLCSAPPISAASDADLVVDAPAATIRAVNRIVPPGPYGAVPAEPLQRAAALRLWGAAAVWGAATVRNASRPTDRRILSGPKWVPEEADLGPGMGPPMGPGMGRGTADGATQGCRRRHRRALGPACIRRQQVRLHQVRLFPFPRHQVRRRCRGRDLPGWRRTRPSRRRSRSKRLRPSPTRRLLLLRWLPRRRRLPLRRNDRNSPRLFRTDWWSRPPILLALPRPLHRPVSELRRFARNDSLVADDVVLERRRTTTPAT